MDSRHSVRLPDDLIRSIMEWGAKEIAAGRFNNKYTSNNADKEPEKQANGKLAEFAFAQWAGLDRDAVKLTFDNANSSFDVVVGDKLVEVRSCEGWKFCLIWPAKKASEFEKRVFTHMVLVKFKLPFFEMTGWVTKDRFRDEHIVAVDGVTWPTLTAGSLYMREDDLDDMDSFSPPIPIGPVCAQCGGGEGTIPPTDAPTVSFGGVMLHEQCLRFYK